MNGKRQYRSPLDFVQSGFSACLRNATDLVTASKVLIDANLHAPALSVAVLALEELGKLGAIDGLLFARPDDSKSKTHAKAGRYHPTKLDFLPLLPMLIDNLSLCDPRHMTETAHAQALAFGLNNLVADGSAVLDKLPQHEFRDLDDFKKRGFYADANEHSYVLPRDAVDPSLAKLVQHYAWRATNVFEFVTMNGNLDRYFEMARNIRAKATEHDHQDFERIGSNFLRFYSTTTRPKPSRTRL